MEIMAGSAGGKPIAEPGAAQRVGRWLENPEGRVEVTVTSAVALTAAQRRQVRKMLRTVVPGEPIVTETVDPQVLGGLLLQVGDRVYDASVAGKLGALVGRIARPPARAT
jgi:F-type H+-transporting ATPase subunit delta